MNTSATRSHLVSKRHRAVWKHGQHSAQVERLDRAISYLTQRLYCRDCGNPDCPKARGCHNPYWRKCPRHVSA